MKDELKPPYEYNKVEFYKLMDEYRSGGPCSSQKYNGKIDWRLVRHIQRIEYMSYGVSEWMYNKALNGCGDALWKLEYGYDLYTEVKNKRNEEQNSTEINR